VIGKMFAPGEKAPYRHPEVYLRERTDGPERLRIGAGVATMDLFRTLLAHLPEPLFVLIPIHAPRTGDGVKLESKQVSPHEIERFLDRFGELFEDDARAQLWIGQLDGAGMLVLDEHDLIYAYGPLTQFESVLVQRGLSPGDPVIPEPHEHRSSAQFDPLEADLRKWWDWQRVQVLPMADQLEPL
jgi:hypothetical protein